MTDRELLELAAKAAEIEGSYGFASDDYYYHGNTEGILTTLPDGQSYVWNPITDDGDALRLAVKLKIGFWVDSFDACCSWVPEGQRPFTEGMAQLAEEVVNDDPCAATRRAIVRAAAEIGRGMP
jgi:hypothetical protein